MEGYNDKPDARLDTDRVFKPVYDVTTEICERLFFFGVKANVNSFYSESLLICLDEGIVLPPDFIDQIKIDFKGKGVEVTYNAEENIIRVKPIIN